MVISALQKRRVRPRKGQKFAEVTRRECGRPHPFLWLQGSAMAVWAERVLTGGEGARRQIPTLSKTGIRNSSWAMGLCLLVTKATTYS